MQNHSRQSVSLVCIEKRQNERRTFLLHPQWRRKKRNLDEKGEEKGKREAEATMST